MLYAIAKNLADCERHVSHDNSVAPGNDTRQILGARPDIRVVGDRFVFQSEVLFPPGSADLSASGAAEIPYAGTVAYAVWLVPSSGTDVPGWLGPLAGDFKATFALDLAHKDLRLALEMADELGVPGMIAPQVMNLMRMARGMGLGSSDSASVVRVYETALNEEIRAGKT